MSGRQGEEPQPLRRAVRARTAAVAAVALLLGAALADCGSEPTQRYGADLSKVGPQTTAPGDQLPTAAASGVYQPAAGPGDPAQPTRPTPQATRPVVPAALTRLTAKLTAAMAGSGHPPARLQASLSGGGALLRITWTVSVTVSDGDARDRVRRDVRTVLSLVHDSSLGYGSMQLAVRGAVKDRSGRPTQGAVLLAGYSHVLVRSTDFARVPPARIFTVPGGSVKIHPAFR